MGVFIIILYKAVLNLVSFILLMSAILAGFTSAYWILLRNSITIDTSDNNFESFWFSLNSVMAFLGGDFSAISNVEHTTDINLLRILFMVSTTIMLLNILSKCAGAVINHCVFSYPYTDLISVVFSCSRYSQHCIQWRRLSGSEDMGTQLCRDTCWIWTFLDDAWKEEKQVRLHLIEFTANLYIFGCVKFKILSIIGFCFQDISIMKQTEEKLNNIVVRRHLKKSQTWNWRNVTYMHIQKLWVPPIQLIRHCIDALCY